MLERKIFWVEHVGFFGALCAADGRTMKVDDPDSEEGWFTNWVTGTEPPDPD